MYKVYCNIHYECNYIDDREYGEYADFQDAVNVFFDLATGKEKLDFSGMDDTFADLIEQEYIDEGEVYGANVNLLRTAEKPEDWDEELLSVQIEKDPYSDAVTYNEIEIEGELSAEEKELIEYMMHGQSTTD